jgi:hypothetical protein
MFSGAASRSISQSLLNKSEFTLVGPAGLEPYNQTAMSGPPAKIENANLCERPLIYSATGE